VLGLLCGLGALAKPNFLIFAVVLFTAGLSQREVRGRLVDPRMLLTFRVAGVAVLPHLLWLLGHGRLDATQSAQPWALPPAEPPLGAVTTGLVELVWA
jgi:4-amino-4-deoxy-L-arabinose transferase-like glycosyltransferase